MASACMVFLPFFVFDATFTTIVRPHPLRTPLTCSMQETIMRVRGVSKLAFLSVTDIQTYIHTDAKRDAKQD